MRIDITRQELEVIVDCLKGSPLKCQKQLRERLAQALDCRLHPSKAPDSNGWAPMRIKSSWPSGAVKSGSKGHWSYHKPRDKKPTQVKEPKKPLTADEILASL